MALPIKLENTSAEILLEVPGQASEKVAIFLPGVSGGAFSDRYQPLVDACIEADIAIARLSSYAGAKELEQKTIQQLHSDIDAAVAFLQARGYTKIFGIGKSFGGALMLTCQSAKIAAKVLWAPAIAAVDAESNLNEYIDVPLGSVPMLMDIKIDKDFLEKFFIPILIVHGTADDQIPFSNSEKIVTMLPEAQLIPIEGADHSYKNKAHEEMVVYATIDFLKGI